MTARLILICHGSTDALRKSVFPADEPLDETGRAGAAALIGHLPYADQYWSSPELRTRQTAEALQLNAKVQPELHDCDYGAWTGRGFDDVCARDPAAVSEWLNDPAATPHGGDSILSLIHRVAKWLAVEQANDQRSIIITHPTVIRAAVVHAIGAAPHSFWRVDITPLSITRLSGTRGRWNLMSVGCKHSRQMSD